MKTADFKGERLRLPRCRRTGRDAAGMDRAGTSRPRRRVMFFGGPDEEARKLNGLVFPHPALIFKVAVRDLFERAVARNSRPSPGTPMKMAPYWNTDGRAALPGGSPHTLYLLRGFVQRVADPGLRWVITLKKTQLELVAEAQRRLGRNDTVHLPGAIPTPAPAETGALGFLTREHRKGKSQQRSSPVQGD